VNAWVFVLELMRGETFVMQMVSGASANCFRPSMDHDSDRDVHARQLVAHDRQPDFLMGLCPEIEDAIGRGRYLVFYLVGGLVAMLAQVLADRHSTVPNLGASGAIAAVMGAFLVTYPRDQIRTLLFIFVFARIRFIPAALLIGLWFLSQLFHAGAVAHVQTGGVAYLAHIGGFIFGAATARWFEDPRRIA
jgi:membrane associated rhomboid family serine protease